MKNLKQFFNQIISHIRAINWRAPKTKKKALVGAVLVVVLMIILAQGGDEASTGEIPLRKVTLIETALYANTAPLQSENMTNEIIVRAETGGKVTKTISPGTQVASGAVVAELENGAQRAMLLQAEGALETARASSEKAVGGLRSEQISSRESAARSAETGAVNALLGAYATMDSAIKDTADQMFSNIGETIHPVFIIDTKDSQQKSKLEQMRFALTPVLSREAEGARTISTNSDLLSELTTTEKEVRTARTFADALITALSEGIPTDTVTASQITTYRAEATAVRTALTTTLSTLAGARTALETAGQSLKEGLTYVQDTDMRAALGALKQAEGAYASTLSQYQKTIIRASGSGVVTSCAVSVGDVINAGSDICRISNSGVSSGMSYALPLSAVRYTPRGAAVATVVDGHITFTQVTTGMVTANTITVTGVLGTEHIVLDVRGLKEGEKVELSTN